MATFNVDQYLLQKYGAPNPEKIDQILQARQEKLAGLETYRQALAQNTAQVARDQAIDEGRSWGDYTKDLALSAVQGIDGLAKLPAMVYDKATTGDWYGPETQDISKMSDEREKLKSAFAQAKNQEKAVVAGKAGKAAREALGDGVTGVAGQVAAEFGAAFWEAAKDPGSIPEFLAQQAAQLGVMSKVGRGAELAAAATAKTLPKVAATKAGQIAVEKSGTAAAVGTGAVLQGVDVGSDTMQRMMSLPDAVWDQNPEYVALAESLGPQQAKQAIASQLAGEATLKAGAVSLFSSALPGGTAIEKALIGKKAGGFVAVPKAFVGEAGQEGIEEGSGRYFGNSAVKEIKPAQELFDGVGAAAGQGAFMGGIMGGGIQTLKSASEMSLLKFEKKVADATKAEALQAAIVSGDVTTFLDPKSPSYAPDQAVSALYGHSQLPTATPELKQAKFEQASGIVSDLLEQKQKAEENYASISPEAVAGYMAQLVQAREAGDQPTVDALEAELATLAKETDAGPRLQKQISRLDEQIASAQEVLNNFNQENQSKELDVEAEAAKITAADPVASQAAADSIINLSMATPERLDTNLAASLANDTTNGLTDPQRGYLRAFTQARQAENQLKTMDKVSKEVFYGGKGNIGIQQYRANVTTALAANNSKAATAQLQLLDNFVSDHQQKAQVAAEAKALFEKDGQERRIVSDGNGSWSIETGKWPSQKERQQNGGLDIVRNSTKIVDNIQIESDALTKAATELRAAYGLKFAQPISNGVSNVSNVSQTLEGLQASPNRTETAPSTEAGTSQPTGGVEGGAVNPSVPATAATESAAGQTVESVSGEPAASVGASGSTRTTVASPETNQGQLQSTEQTSTTPSEVVPVSEEVASALSTQPGAVTTLQEKSTEGTSFPLRNLIADFFTQQASREGDLTERPLVKVKNFLSQGAQNVLDFLGIKSLSGKQQEVLQLFQELNQQWQGLIQKNLSARTKEFRYEDMMQYLIQENDGKLDVDQNVKTAISYAVFSWVAEAASKNLYNTDEDINAILDRDETVSVSQAERMVLGNVGVRENLVRNSLGQAVVQALGFKVSKDAPVNLMPDLEASLGAHAWKLMMDLGLLERSTVSGETMAALTNKESTNTNAEFHFVKLARNAQSTLPADAERIVKASIGSQGVLDKLFSVESGLKEPSLEPVPFVQKKTRNTNQNVPEKLAKIVAAKNAEANYVRQDMWQLITQLGDDVLQGIAGVVEISDTKTHAVNKPGLQAKNDGLLRELDRFMEFVKSMADIEAPMYFEHSVWKQQRVGIATNVINPQTSKIHRFMLFRNAWTTMVDMGNADQMDNFRLRVLEGLGVKTDKQANKTSLAAYESYVNQPEIKAAVAVLRKTVFEGGITSEEGKVLLAGVKKGGMNFHSLDALMALATEAQAQLDGKNSFSVQMMGEVDGVTNGPMLSHILLGAAKSVKDLFGLLNRGGFFEKSNPNTNYNVWRGKPGAKDLYEITALHMTNAVQKMLLKDSKIGATLNAVYAFTGNLTLETPEILKKRRNIIKTPLTAMIFGSSVGSAVDSMADGFIESIYSSMEDVAAGKADIRATINNINVLLRGGDGAKLSLMSVEKLLAYEFDSDQIKALKNSFKNTLGKAVSETMSADFGNFISKRDALNKSAQFSFELYNAAYMGLRDAYLAELVASGEIAVDSKNRPIHDLTLKQQEELKKRVSKLAPVMHTLMSKESGSLRAGLFASKSSRKLSTRSTFKSNVKFGSAIKGTKVWSKKKGGYVEQSSVEATAFETIESNPGVAMVVMSTHSLDSAISHNAADGNEVLNIHDAHGSGLGGFSQTAQNLNQATWSALLNYSPATEMANMLSRTVVGLSELLAQKDLPVQVVENLTQALNKFAGENEMSPDTVLSDMLQNATSTAFSADSVRLEALSQMGSVDQYALEGGNYEVTEADRSDAAAMQSALKEGLSAKEQEALVIISEALGMSVSEKPAPATEKPVATADSLFGPIGTPKIESDGDLVRFFKANPNASASQVIALLGAPGRMNAINRKILALVSRVVSPDLKIKFVTSETAESMVLEKPTTNSRGWYVVKNGQEEIYVLSPEFQNSGLTAETLLHELVHAAIARVIDKPTGEAAALVAELEALRVKAQEYAKQNGLNDYTAALANVQEFVAWGMTNLGLQRDVLSKITMESKTGSTSLITGMKKFIATLTQLLFKKPDENLNNGMAVLVANVSGLFAEAAQAKKTSNADLNLAQETVEQIDKYTTLDIHNALANGSVEPSFQEHLANLLGGIVEKLHGPFGAFAEQMRKTEAGNPLAVWLKAMETGNAPFASSIVASGFAGSAQEDFAMQQVEATVRAALNGNESQTKIAYKQLADLYLEMRNTLKPSDFASQEDYDFVFKLESNNGDRSDYLARFAALGLASEKFNTLLKRATKVASRKAAQDMTFTEKLESIFERILNFFNEKFTHTYAGQNADAKLEALVGQLVDIEAKKRVLIKKRATERSILEPVERGVKALADGIREKAGDLAGSSFVRNNGNAFVQAAGGIARTIANDRVEQVIDGLKILRDQQFKGRQGIAASLLNELKGPLDKFNALLRETKRHEGERKNIITQHSKLVLSVFQNGKAMSKEAKAAVSAVFLRTGLHNLLNHYSVADLEKLVGDYKAVDKAIENFESQLTSKYKDKYIEQINGLGYFKATGRARIPVLMLNAHLISRMANTQYQRQISEAEAKQAEPVIAALISLYALKYTAGDHLSQAKEVFRTENSRTDNNGNGVEFLLKLHKQLEEESLQRLFKGNPALMIHGYTPEILNPHTAIKIATEAEGKELVNQGYSAGALVSNDRADPDTETKRIYVLRDGGLSPWLSGAFSLSSMKSRGSKKHSGYVNVNTLNGLENASMQATITNEKLAAMQGMGDPRRDLSAERENHMIPVYNETGAIVNWRYMMAESTKDNLLERDNRFENLIGVIAGSIYDKETSREQNKKAVTVLREQYELEYATRKDSYVEVGDRSTDPEMRAIWDLLPDATKKDIRAVWGRDGMKVRSDSLDIMFGYRKLTLASMFQKDPDARNKLEGLFVYVVQTVLANYAGMRHGLSAADAEDYAKRAAVVITRGERAWQELVAETKDIIVVKTGFVMLGNIWSNLSLLAMSGVSLKDVLQHHLVALKGATAYQRDSQRLADLQTMLEVDYGLGKEKEIKDEIVRLKDAIARNPVKELIEAGLMPTIVEDLAAEENIYSYKSEFVRKTEKFTSRLNPKIRAAGRAVYMTHDTNMYQTLSRITQLSDFVARYTLYQHLVSRGTNPLSREAAIQEASDAFVNYDIPMHRGLQYTDDMGLTPFTKYFLRIQRVLLKLARENPARVLSAIALNHYMELGPIVLDSSFTQHIGNNPLHSGAFQYFGALDNLATVHTAMAIVK